LSGAFNRVYEIVRQIPEGRVLTYGLISDIMERRISAQAVGWALKGSGAKDIPWHRVVNARGTMSTHKNPDIEPGLQKRLLEAEGVIFDEEERIDLDRYLWMEGLANF